MNDVSVEDFSRLVSGIYAAAVSPQCWRRALDGINRRLDGVGGALLIPDGEPWYVSTLPPEAGEAYQEYYHRFDRVAAAAARGPVGVLRTGTELMPLVRHTEFSEWLRPYAIDDAMVVRLSGGEEPACLILAAARRTEPFAASERVKLMNGLIPHLQQALLTQHRFAEVARRKSDFAMALQAVRHGVVILGRDGLVIDLNAAAEEILCTDDGLRLQSRRIAATSSPSDRRLRQALHDALRNDPSTVGGGRSFVCERPSGQRPYLLQVLPLPRSGTAEFADGARALILIKDPHEETGRAAAALRRCYGLTASETDVALRIARGAELREICDELSISISTVRKHLQHVFDKTDTHRQAELVRVVLTFTQRPGLGGD